MGRSPFCEKQGQLIEGSADNPVNQALVGFPDWCPLDSVRVAGERNGNYKKEIKTILRIMENDSSSDALSEASHYLNSVIEDVKKKAQANQL
jgi:hypothetical protein